MSYPFSEVVRAGPADAVTTVENVAASGVTGGSGPRSGLQDIALAKLLVVVGVDDEAPDRTALDDLDVFPTDFEPNLLVEFFDHANVDLGQDAFRAALSPERVVCLDIFDQLENFILHVSLAFCLVTSLI